MSNIVKKQVNVYKVTCASCSEPTYKLRKYIQVVNEYGKDVRGERYCLSCEDVARLNNPPSVSPYRDDITFITGSNGVEHAKNSEGEWLY